jgi:hypothetical protein
MFAPNTANDTDPKTESVPQPLLQVKPPDDLFLFERSNRRQLDRGKRGFRLSPADFPIWLQAIFAVILVVMLVGTYLGGVNLLRWLFTSTSGVTTEAQIIDKRISRGKSTSYNVTYAFTVNDQRYVVSQRVSRHIYDLAKEVVDIVYWPSNPNFARLIGKYEINNMFAGSAFKFV